MRRLIRRPTKLNAPHPSRIGRGAVFPFPQRLFLGLQKNNAVNSRNT